MTETTPGAPDPDRDDAHQDETAVDVQDIEDDPAYEPDDDTLKDVKGG